MSEYMGLQDVARVLNVTYWRVTYAHQSGQVPYPMRVAGKLLYSPDDVERLRSYFSDRPLKKGENVPA